MIKRILLAAVLLASGVAHAQLYNKFGPVNGVLKGDSTSPQTSLATITDIQSLLSGSPGVVLGGATGGSQGVGTVNATGLYVNGSPVGISGGGVSSVGLTAPSVFGVTGSPVTAAGSLGLTFATGQTANRVLATPDGTTGALSLRALVAGDIPPINLGSTANGGVSSATILLGTNGGTSNGFFSVTGPATALRTFTFPNASAAVLTSNAAVTVAQGGTGDTTLTNHGVLLGQGTSNVSAIAAMSLDTLLQGQGASADPAAVAVPNCGSGSTALNYSTSTHAFGCQTITVGTGTVTSITAGAGISATPGSPITTSGTLSVDQGFSPTWTGNHTFTLPVVNSGTTTNNFVSGTNAAVSGGFAGFLNNRPVTTLTNYGFADISSVTPTVSGPFGHAVFNDRVTIIGSNAMDHHHGFQGWPIYNNSNTLSNLDVFWAQPEVDQGTVTSLSGFHFASTVHAGGTITTAYGLLVDDMTGIGTTNYSVFTSGTTPSQFGGAVTVGGGVTAQGTVSTSIATSLVSIGSNSGLPDIQMVNSAGATNSKVWDCYADTTDYHCRVINDAHSAATDWLDVTRNGAGTVSTINFLATNVKVNGAAIGGASLSANNTWTGIQTFQNDNGAAGTAILSNTVAGHQSNLAFFTDTSTQVMDLLAESATAGTGCATGAPTGQAGCLYIQGNFPFSIATNGNERVRVAGSGSVTINAPTSANTLGLTGTANFNALAATGSATTGQSFGLGINAGTNSSDAGLRVFNTSVSLQFEVRGDGEVEMPALAQTNVAQTGSVCWGSARGQLTVDTLAAGCLTSARRFKENINPLDIGLLQIMRLRPVTYNLKPEYDPYHIGRQVGLIAEEVETVDPRLMARTPDGKQALAVRYQQLTAVLVMAVQQQQIEIVGLGIAVLGLFSWCVCLQVKIRRMK